MSGKYVVDGYCFQSETDANNARNEIDGIEYLKKRTNFKNPESVLAIYNKIIEKQLFKTPIGYGFLRELQQILYNSPEIEEGTVRDIPVQASDGKRDKKSKDRNASLMPEAQEKKYKNRITNMIILNVVLVIAIIVIIIMTNNSSNTNILNYRERLDREYQEKENDLAVWAGQLREKEEQLNGMEQGK